MGASLIDSDPGRATHLLEEALTSSSDPKDVGCAISLLVGVLEVELQDTSKLQVALQSPVAEHRTFAALLLAELACETGAPVGEVMTFARIALASPIEEIANFAFVIILG